ncbi:nuclear transport factor 2 family protein [Pandoraea anapnoica]
MAPLPGSAISAAATEGLGTSGSATPAVPASQLAANKQAVLAFYEAGLNRKDFTAARQYLGDKYVQHNPNAPDGVEGFGKFVDFLRKNQPDSHSDIVRAFADGDFVILHVRKVPHPGDLPIAIVDIFRLEKGKIVEHWDVSQQTPAKTVSGNSMF